MNGSRRLTSGLDALASSLLAATAVALSSAWLALLLAAFASLLDLGGTATLLVAALSLAMAFGACAFGSFACLAVGSLAGRAPLRG